MSPSIHSRVPRMAMAVFAALLVLFAGSITNAQPASATTCRTINVSGSALNAAIYPRMSVPVCYNGSQIWPNGGVTPGVSTLGYYVGGFDWYGTFNDSSRRWLGAGENFTATIWGGWYSTYCSPRWYINAQGKVYSYSRGC